MIEVKARSGEAALEDLWEHDHQVHRILRESSDVEEGRIALFSYLKDLEWKYRRGDVRQPSGCHTAPRVPSLLRARSL